MIRAGSSRCPVPIRPTLGGPADADRRTRAGARRAARDPPQKPLALRRFRRVHQRPGSDTRRCQSDRRESPSPVALREVVIPPRAPISEPPCTFPAMSPNHPGCWCTTTAAASRSAPGAATNRSPVTWPPRRGAGAVGGVPAGARAPVPGCHRGRARRFRIRAPPGRGSGRRSRSHRGRGRQRRR